MIDFLAFHNILFLASMFVGLMIVIGAATGGVDLDADAGFDTDVAAGLDVDADSDMVRHGILSFLDLGQVPFTVLLMVSSLVFGTVGLAGSFVSVNLLGTDTPWLGWLWIGIAFIVMIAVTGRVAKLVIKHIPASETHVISKADLVGVRATMLTSQFADVNRGGTVHRLHCVCDFCTLEPGMQVEVTDYNPETERFSVSPIFEK